MNKALKRFHMLRPVVISLVNVIIFMALAGHSQQTRIGTIGFSGAFDGSDYINAEVNGDSGIFFGIPMNTPVAFDGSYASILAYGLDVASDGFGRIRLPGYKDMTCTFSIAIVPDPFYQPGIYGYPYTFSAAIWVYAQTTDNNVGAASVGNAGSNVQNPQSFSKDPVDTGTGDHVITRSYLTIHGAQDVTFSIDYDSICHFEDVLGMGWSHNYEARAQPETNGFVRIIWNSKKSNLFSLLPGRTNVYTCSDLPVIYDTLTIGTNGGFSMREPSQRHFEFDDSGRLQQVVNSHGQVIQLIYSYTNSYPTQILETVSGKSFYLNYNTNRLLSAVSDDLGRNLNFGYDSTNNLIQIVRNDGHTSETNGFLYDGSSRVKSEFNPEGVRIFTDTYDTNGCIVTQQDAANGVTTFTYDVSQTNRIITTVIDRTGATNTYVHNQNYLLLSVTDGLGHTTGHRYDNYGNQIAVTNSLGHFQTFAYDSSGNQVAAIDAAGKTTLSQYDGNNSLIVLTNAVRSVATFAYDNRNNLTNSLDFLTNQISFVYDTNSLLTQSTSARGGVSIFTNSAGLLASLTDAATNTTSMAYDVIGRLMAVTNAAGFVSTNAYDLNDNLIATADGLGNLWRYSYDSAGRKLTAIDPLSNTTFFVYNGNGDLISTTNALDGVNAYTYDGEDRLQTATDANGNTRTMAYDAAGRLVSVSDALSHTNVLQYDAVGNLIATTDALGTTNQITQYDVRNQPTNTIDALGNSTQMSYDTLRRVIQTVDALWRTNSFGFDAMNRLTNRTDPLALVTSQHFDGDGNRTAIINPKLAPFGFQYDPADRLTNTVTPALRNTGYTLDGRNLVTNIVQSSGAQTTVFYDGAGRLTNSQDTAGTIVYGYDPKGRLRTIAENSKTITRQYDALDRLTNYTDSASNVLKYVYDAVGNLRKLTYPDGKTVAYSYDAANRLTNVLDWGGRTTVYAYDADNRITNIALPNGVLSSKSYDPAGRLKQQQDTLGPTNIFSVIYAYDNAGQIIGEFRQPAATAFQPTNVDMTFDADNALVSYDGQTVTNDANGNMIHGPLTDNFADYTYDVRNRLTGAGGVSYGYDPAGNRVAITNGAEVTQFVVNPNAALSQVLMRIRNGVTNYYVYGAGLVYEVTQTPTTTNVLVHHYDYRGSTVAMTDGNGKVTDTVSYSPYGSITYRTGTRDTPFLFNGSYGVQTDANGLLYMRARFYNPTICRFLDPDPIQFSGGANLYAYANGSPIKCLDPLGLCTASASQQVDYDQAMERLLKAQAINDAFINNYVAYLIQQGFSDVLSDSEFANLLFSMAEDNPNFKAVLNGANASGFVKNVSSVLEAINYGQMYSEAGQSFAQGNPSLGISYTLEFMLSSIAASTKNRGAIIATVAVGAIDYWLDNQARNTVEPMLKQVLQNAINQRQTFNNMIGQLNALQNRQ